MRAHKLQKRPTPDLSERARNALVSRLSPLLRRTLSLTLTANRTTMISVRREPDRLVARVHHRFVGAPDTIVHLLARYLEKNARDASRAIGHFIERGIPADESPGPVRRTERRADPIGFHHDLQFRFDRLNACLFERRVEARITWGPRPARPRHRESIRIGSYSVEDRTIRIHQALDRPWVPRYFVDWIIFHEMLHQIHDIPVVGGRRIFHSREFLAHERTFPEYRRARRWQSRNLVRLLNA